MGDPLKRRILLNVIEFYSHAYLKVIANRSVISLVYSLMASYCAGYETNT